MPAKLMIPNGSGSWIAWAKHVTPLPPVIQPFTLGQTRPTAENTGLNVNGLSTDDLELVNGDVTYSTNNTTIYGKHFNGTVTVTGKNIVFDSCWFNANKNANQVYVLNNNVENLIVRNSLFSKSSTPVGFESCIFGKRFTLERCDLSGSCDLVGIVGSSTAAIDLAVKIQGNYMHHQDFRVPAPWSDNQTHNDSIQIHYGGQNISIVGNTFTGRGDATWSSRGAPTYVDGVVQSGNPFHPSEPYALSWVMASPQSAAAGLTNFLFDRNWAGGGAVGINWPRTDGVNIRITNNRWGEGTWFVSGNAYILMKTAQSATITGNVRYGNVDYTGTPTTFNVRQNN